MDLTYFNPHAQEEADFLANFVARQGTLDFFLGQLRIEHPGQAPPHHLVVAPRGYGKTSLLRRIAVAVRTEPDLRQRFIALTFREEQHNVISLDAFWRNCLQSLLEAREDEDAPAGEIAELDAAWERFSPRQHLKRGEQDGEPAWLEFRRRCAALKRRPLLLMDNVDALLAGLESAHQWALRRTLQHEDGPLLIAAAPRHPDAASDQAAPFHDVFHVQTLDKLSDREVLHCLRTLATRRGERGRSVSALLDSDPGRVAALNALAGGNPRTLNVLYGVLESHMNADVLAQLSAMLDIFTPWYQARTEELPMQGRAVFDALALNWNPMTAASLGEATGLDTTAVSSQLSRLERAGYVETVALSKRAKGRNGYQIGERFFNIWYLMRNGPRRRRNEIRFLTAFLQACFSDIERRSMARAALENDDLPPGHSLALASSLRRGRLRDQLLEHAQSLSARLGERDEYAALIEEIQRAGQGATGPKRPSSLEDALAMLDRCIDALKSSGDSATLAQTLLGKGRALVLLRRNQDALDIYDLVVSRFGHASDQALSIYVGEALRRKAAILYLTNRSEEAVEVCDDMLRRLDGSDEPTLASEAFKVLVQKANALISLRRFEEALGICERLEMTSNVLAEPDRHEQLSLASMAKLVALSQLDRRPEVIGFAESLVERFSSGTDLSSGHVVAMALTEKGKVLERLGEAVQAIEVYGEVVTRFAANVQLRRIVGEAQRRQGELLLASGRFEDAGAALRRAAEIDPESSSILNSLARFLLDRVGESTAALETLLRGAVGHAGHASDAEVHGLEAEQSAIHSDLAYVSALHGDDVSVARRHAHAAMEGAGGRSAAGRLLLEALVEVVDSRSGDSIRCIERIGQAVESGDANLWSVYLVELQRLITHLLLKGQGGAFRTWMDEAQYPTKYAPLYHAVVAAIEGEDHLLRINPEVRQPAELIHEGIARMLALYGKKSRRARRV